MPLFTPVDDQMILDGTLIDQLQQRRTWLEVQRFALTYGGPQVASVTIDGEWENYDDGTYKVPQHAVFHDEHGQEIEPDWALPAWDKLVGAQPYVSMIHQHQEELQVLRVPGLGLANGTRQELIAEFLDEATGHENFDTEHLGTFDLSQGPQVSLIGQLYILQGD